MVYLGRGATVWLCLVHQTWPLWSSVSQLTFPTGNQFNTRFYRSLGYKFHTIVANFPHANRIIDRIVLSKAKKPKIYLDSLYQYGMRLMVMKVMSVNGR